MIHLAFVEDDASIARAIRKNIDRYTQEKSIEIQATHFPRAEELLDGYTPRFDLILMDIRLEGGMTGMEAAQELRKLDSTVQLIFITSLAQYAVKSYEVGALDFVLKPFSYYQFAMKMDRAVRLISRNEDLNLPVPTPRGIKVLPSRGITYLEVSDHNLVYHTESGEYRTRDSLSRLEKLLESRSFVRISVCYLINLRYVTEMDGSMLVLSTGDRLTISRAKKKEVLAALAKYLGGGI